MSHTTASDLGIIDCFFFFFFFVVVDCRNTRVSMQGRFHGKNNAPLALDKIGQCLKFNLSGQILKH